MLLLLGFCKTPGFIYTYICVYGVLLDFVLNLGFCKEICFHVAQCNVCTELFFLPIHILSCCLLCSFTHFFVRKC